MNKVILIGNLGRDPEQRYTQNGNAVANMSLATVERYTKDGERQENTEWHRLVAWGRTAEVAGQYLVKGSKVAVEGRLQTREWEDREGNKRYTTEVVVDRLEMLGGKKREGHGKDIREMTDQQRYVTPEGEDLSDHMAPAADDDDIPF